MSLAAFEIEHAEAFAEFPVRLGLEVEFRSLAPDLHHLVVVLTLADRDALVRNVGNGGQDRAESCVLFFDFLFERGNLLAHLLGLFDLRRGVLLLFLQLGDRFRDAVALGLQVFHLLDGGATLLVDGVKVFQDFGRILAALPQLLFNEGEIVSYKR